MVNSETFGRDNIPYNDCKCFEDDQKANDVGIEDQFWSGEMGGLQCLEEKNSDEGQV